jgi:6-phosphogluconolactonase/glucosamine-6-phosphate isomerase/deaminase
MNIHTEKTEEAAAIAAGAHFNSLVGATTGDMLLALSGGSALKMLDHIDALKLTSRVSIVVLDERFSSDPNINNSIQLKERPAIQQAIKQGAQFFDTIPESTEKLEEFAQRYERILRAWKEKHAQGTIIATAGIGPDGHTLGMMPFSEDTAWFTKNFVATDRWVKGYDAEIKSEYPLRATTTVPFAKEINHCIYFVCGANKKSALDQALAPEGELADTPARLMQQIHDVHLFTDQPVVQ